jgi:hypothetical protein
LTIIQRIATLSYLQVLASLLVVVFRCERIQDP